MSRGLRINTIGEYALRLSNLFIDLLSLFVSWIHCVNQHSKTISYMPDSQRTLSPFTNTCLLFSDLQLISPVQQGKAFQQDCVCRLLITTKYLIKKSYTNIMSGFKQTQSTNQTHFITIILLHIKTDCTNCHFFRWRS